MAKKILNAKVTEELIEAVRVVTFNEKYASKSALIVHILESHPLISKHLKK
jgi:hypothetical protein